MDLKYMIEIIPRIVVYMPITILMAIFAMLLALAIGACLTFLYRKKALKWLIDIYLLIFRGFPTIVILFVIYFGLPQVLSFGNNWSATVVATICLGLKQAAYSVEVFRSALDAVPRGQLEAGLAIGLKTNQVYRRIIIPQAIKTMIPSLGNNFTALLKETSLAFSIGVTEMFGEGKIIASTNFRYFEVYFVVGILYVLIIYVYSILQEFIEEKVNFY